MSNYNLKNLSLLNLNGGGMNKIFNLSKKYPEYKKGFLQKNLDKFYKTYGSDITINYEDRIQIDIKLIKVKLLSGIKIYKFIYDIPHRTTELFPFVIDFFDPITYNKNNNAYISNIQKTSSISGSQMVKICLVINKILGAEKVYLFDGSRIKCQKNNEQLDLSLLKLIEKNMTFYMKLGFDFEIGETDWYLHRYSNKNKLKKEVNRLVENIRSIKTQDIIEQYERTLDLIIKMIKDNFSGKLEILKDNSKPTNKNEIYAENPKEKILELFIEAKETLEVLNKYKNYDYLYKIFIKTFKDACNEYSILNKNIIENTITQLIYNNEIIKRLYVIDFNNLTMYRYGLFSYTF